MVGKHLDIHHHLSAIRPQPVTRRPTEVKQSGRGSAAPEVPFADVLKQQTAAMPLKFSAHAEQRMRDRNIRLSDVELARLRDAVDRARAKGARESLVMMDNAAFVVSVRNQTVITAVDRESMKQNVFTNIDSAVIA